MGRPAGGIAGTLALLGFVACLGAAAQTTPDAGSIHRDLERGRTPGATPRQPALPVIEEPIRPALALPAGVRFPVKGFRISQATAFSEAELLALLKDFTGQELSLADLQLAADLVTRHYRSHGYFVARAYLPAQEIRDGIVEIIVLEGRIDRINERPLGPVRLGGGTVERTLRWALPAESPLREDDLERGLLILNDLPGIEVRSTLSPGAAVGASSLVAEISEGDLLSGSADLDSYGNKFTGRFRLGGTVSLNDPGGFGDQASLRITKSSGTSYGRLAYQFPLGASGLKLGAAFAETRYALCCDFDSLDARGWARVATANALYPLVRGRHFNLYGTAAYDTKHFFNATIAGTGSDKKARIATLGLNGDGRDALGGSMNNYAIAVSAGRLDLDGWAADRNADIATARTHGRYAKAAFSLARLHRIGGETSVYASLSGQAAARNLDSSEKFVLGGPQGVRAYPQGEASGDHGLLLNLELRHELSEDLQVAAFLDHGRIQLHRKKWAGWQGANMRTENRYNLSGYGLGLSWSQPGSFLLRASLAFRLGVNPGRDGNGNDADNSKDHQRLWLQAVKYF